MSHELSLPHDLDAERGVLGTMLVRREAIDEAVAHVAPGDWYLGPHRLVFEAIVAVEQTDGELDMVLVLQAMRTKQPDADGAILVELMHEPALADVDTQARRIAGLARARRLLVGLQKLTAEGYRLRDPEQWIESVESTVARLTERDEKRDAPMLDDQIKSVLDTLTEREKPQGDKGYWPTDLSVLNRLIFGFSPGILYIVGATPGIGKTSFLLQLAWKLAGQVHGDETLAVVFFSMEMTHGEIGERMVSQAGLVPNEAMKRGQLNGHWSAIMGAAHMLNGKPLYVDDTPGLSVLQIRSRTRRHFAKMQRKNPDRKLRLALIVCDHLQLMVGTGETRAQELASITGALAKFAKEQQCAVAALSQLNRNQQKDKFRRPALADLRESGAIEADANTVILLHDENAQKSEGRSDETLAIVAKNRGGRTGDVRLRFKGECTLFSVPEHDPEFEPSGGFDEMGGMA